MAKGYLLSESDLVVLKQLIDWWRRSGSPSLAQGDSNSYYQSPDTFVAALPVGGIPGMEGMTPGSALCYLYRIDHVGSSGTLAALNIQRRIFNLDEDAITGAYAPVTRTKSGAWILTSSYSQDVDTGTGTQCILTIDGHVIEDLDTEASPSYVLGIDSSGCLVKVEVGTC